MTVIPSFRRRGRIGPDESPRRLDIRKNTKVSEPEVQVDLVIPRGLPRSCPGNLISPFDMKPMKHPLVILIKVFVATSVLSGWISVRQATSDYFNEVFNSR